MMRLRKRARRRAGEPSAHEKVERMRQMRGMRGDLEDLMVEIDQLARRFGAQLDAKGLQLERLIEEADRRIARLEALGRAPDGPVEEQPTPEDPLARSVYDLADKGADATKIAHELNEHVGKVELILALRNAG
ncbi:MAG: hypothetical protein CMJ18_17540 [Phycisphaeraceae bacterium]|nr:hypothetical protein [Phycisphaeraceae bacterium]